jgi:hypothetical protein
VDVWFCVSDVESLHERNTELWRVTVLVENGHRCSVSLLARHVL